MNSRRYVVQVDGTVQRSNSIELATTLVSKVLSVEITNLRRQILMTGVAIGVKGDKQGYIFDTKFVTNDSNQLQ